MATYDFRSQQQQGNSQANDGAAPSSDESAAQRGESSSRAEALVDVLEDFFQTACEEDERLSRRLTAADTIWATQLTDADLAYTVYLDRFPIEFTREATSDAEVTTWGATNDLIDAWTGRVFLGIAIARGAIEYEGPVRKVLRIVPMFRPLAKHGSFRDLRKQTSEGEDEGKRTGQMAHEGEDQSQHVQPEAERMEPGGPDA